MKLLGAFIFIIVIAGAFVAGLVFFPNKTALIAPASVAEVLPPIIEEVVTPTTTPQITTTTPEVVTTSSIKATTSLPIKPTSTPPALVKSTSTSVAVKPTTTPVVGVKPPVKTQIVISSSSGMQGEPVQIIFSGTKSVEDILSVTVNGISLPAFLYKDVVQGIYGIDINHKIGSFPITAKLKDETTASGTLTVLERKKPTESFTIPDSLGGTNPVGEQNVATLLTKENAILANLTTNPKKLWTETFRYPTEIPVITDPYGYNRDTGTQTVTHKGTDFRAPLGTPVYAVNRGVARLVETFTIYGKTVIIDHGQGIFTFYMHLSKTSVVEGSIVAAGQKIGESGGTGYAEGPHLHLTVRINGTSIDPLKFFLLYGFPLKN